MHCFSPKCAKKSFGGWVDDFFPAHFEAEAVHFCHTHNHAFVFFTGRFGCRGLYNGDLH